MTFFQVFFRYIMPASFLTWLIWFGIYSFETALMPWKELLIGFLSAFISVVSHIAIAMWAFNKNNVVFMGWVLGSILLQFLLIFVVVGFTLKIPGIQVDVFVSSLLVFYFTYLFLEIFIFAKTANIRSKK